VVRVVGIDHISLRVGMKWGERTARAKRKAAKAKRGA
jgi:hypothetical protein